MLQRLHKELPPAIAELLKIPGIGPKRVKTLYHDLDVQTVEQLYRAARDGRIRTLPGFGEKTELNILQAVETHANQARRFKLAVPAQYAEALKVFLATIPGVTKVTVAGSYRRVRETVGDLDILVAATPSSPVMQRFTTCDDVAETLSAGVTRASVILQCGMQADLRVVAEKSYGAALHYFTGSKSHNIAIRRMAQQRGLKINEYGVYRGEKRIASESEASVYSAVGLHAHTKETDGHNTLHEMALAGKSSGFEYLAITEHSRRLTVTHGLDPLRLARQCDEIDQLNEALEGITLLKGIEVDILEGGNLDLPDNVLARLDLVLGAVHSKFELSRAKQTERILRAMSHPHFTMLAHPTGRLIQQRAPYDVDMSRIIREARNRGCFLELNAHPERLDLLDTYCQMAKEEGVLISINSDAHSTCDFTNLRLASDKHDAAGWKNKMYSIHAR